MYLESGALDHSAILTNLTNITKIYEFVFSILQTKFVTKHLAERSFDLRTSGLWAQHASTAPLCYH